MIHRFPLEPIKNEYAERLAERGFEVVRGFDYHVAQTLHQGITDPEITAHTNDADRFKTVRETFDWHDDPEKERALYNLRDLTNSAIRGVIWFSTSPIAHSPAEYTFAIRMYEKARRKGLAGSFVEAAHSDFVKEQGGGDTWLTVGKTNADAIVLYLNHGYEIVHEDETSYIMERKVPTND